MYGPKLPITGVSFLVLGMSSFYSITCTFLLLITLTIILFRITRLFVKEGRVKRIVVIIFMVLLIILLITYLGKSQANDRINQSEEILKDYKKILYTTHNNNSEISSDFNLTKTPSTDSEEEKIEADAINSSPLSGEVLGLISIERISLELPIIEDANEENLWLGANHIRGTPLYWEKGNSFLASHNLKSYGELFNRVHELNIGDVVKIFNTNNAYSYIVYDIDVVPPDDIECFKKLKGEYNLSLVVCTKSGSERLIVYCERVEESEIEQRDTMRVYNIKNQYLL